MHRLDVVQDFSIHLAVTAKQEVGGGEPCAAQLPVGERVQGSSEVVQQAERGPGGAAE